MAGLAAKKYQREDVALMQCRLAVLRKTAGAAERARLAELSKAALMPQVRRDAAELLGKIGQ